MALPTFVNWTLEGIQSVPKVLSSQDDDDDDDIYYKDEEGFWL